MIARLAPLFVLTLVACGGSTGNADWSAPLTPDETTQVPSPVAGIGGGAIAEPAPVGGSDEPGSPAPTGGAGGSGGQAPMAGGQPHTGAAGGVPSADPGTDCGSHSAGTSQGNGTAGGSTAGGPSACVPRSWVAACEARTCGQVSDGCSGEYQCGGCPSSMVCSSEGKCVDVVVVDPEPVCAPVTGGGQCSVPGFALHDGCKQAPDAACYHPVDGFPLLWCCP
jgi:hypothetical protein